MKTPINIRSVNAILAMTFIDEIELDGVEAEAFGTDVDGEKVFGGRLAIFPVSSLAISLRRVILFEVPGPGRKTVLAVTVLEVPVRCVIISG